MNKASSVLAIQLSNIIHTYETDGTQNSRLLDQAIKLLQDVSFHHHNVTELLTSVETLTEERDSLQAENEKLLNVIDKLTVSQQQYYEREERFIRREEDLRLREEFIKTTIREADAKVEELQIQIADLRKRDKTPILQGILREKEQRIVELVCQIEDSRLQMVSFDESTGEIERYKSQVKSMLEQITDLTLQLELKEAENSELKTKYSSFSIKDDRASELINALGGASHSMATLEPKVEALRNDLRQRANVSSIRHTHVSQTYVQEDDLKKRVDDIRTQDVLQQVAVQLKAKDDEVSSIRTLLIEQEITLKAKIDEVTSLRTLLMEQEVKLNNIPIADDRNVSNLPNQLSDIFQQLVDANGKIDTLQNEVIELKALLRLQSEEFAKVLQQQLENQAIGFQAKLTKSEENEKSIVFLTSRLVEANHQIALLTNENLTIKTSFESTVPLDMLKTAQTQLDELEKQLVEIKESHLTQFSSMKSQLSAYEEKISDLTQQLDEKGQQLVLQLSESEVKAAAFDKELKEVTDAYLAQIKDAQLEISALEDQLKERDERLNSLTSQNSLLTYGADEQIASLKIALASMQAHEVALQLEIETQKVKFDEVTVLLNETKVQLIEVQTQFSTTTTITSSLHEEQLSELRSQISIKEHELSAITAINSAQGEQLSDLQNQIVIKEQELSAIITINSAQGEQLSDLQNQIVIKEQELSAIITINSAQGEKLSELQNQILIKEQEISEMNAKISEYEEQLSEFRNRISIKEQELISALDELTQRVPADKLQSAEARIVELEIQLSSSVKYWDNSNNNNNDVTEIEVVKDKIVTTVMDSSPTTEETQFEMMTRSMITTGETMAMPSSDMFPRINLLPRAAPSAMTVEQKYDVFLQALAKSPERSLSPSKRSLLPDIFPNGPHQPPTRPSALSLNSPRRPLKRVTHLCEKCARHGHHAHQFDLSYNCGHLVDNR